ncbi:TonB-dependent receptor [Catenovulum sediminis]|uniref:TonB-dependent receptor n=1 Tax=Catenovulum sediminis TaxID=1740262 RepID=A0ABV1RIQ7_9ALTE|nr:TonB-dependent receptor [Catenovulum sediminis]
MQFKLSKIAMSLLSASALTMAANANAAETKEEVETIEVKGYTQSLKAAALLKRTDGRIVDAVVAEDIGKLPDNNIAEALQRVTGVSISRDFGVGDSVSIRGLPQNRVEINGRSTVGDGRGGISLQDFPSSFLQAVEVVKSPTPEMIEGALGGTVSLKTIKPLKMKEPLVAMSFDAEYADKTENWAPIFNVAAGNKWDLGDAGTFGAIAMFAYQDRELRRDEFFNRVQAYTHDSIAGIDSPATQTPSGRYLVADQNTVEQKTEKRERTAMNLTLQWAPNDDGFIYLDLNTTDRSGYQDAYSILDVGGSIVATENTTVDEYGQLNNYELQGAFTIPKTWSDFRETESFSHAFGAEWNLSDQLKVSGEIAIASSESSAPKSEFNLRPISQSAWNEWTENWDGSSFNSGTLRHTSTATVIRSGDKIPSVVYADGHLAAQPENLAVRDFFHDERWTENDETAMRFDLEYFEPFGVDFISKIKAGVRTTDRDYKYSEAYYDAKDLYKKMFNDDGTPHAVWINEVEEMFPGSVHTVNHSNSFDQAGFAGENQLTKYRVFKGTELANAEETFKKVQQLTAGTNYATTGSLADNLTENQGAFRDITEKTTALYAQAHLDFDYLTAIVGGRFINTEIESTVYTKGELDTGTHEYDDFLPSLNATYRLTDDTFVRFATAKVMRRADFSELSPAFLIDNSFVTADRGAITLDPYRATQYDLSIEHYYGEGNMVSFAVYYKDVESFLNDSTTCEANSLTSQQNVTEWSNVCQLDTAGVSKDRIITSSLGDFQGEDNPSQAGLDYVESLRAQGLTGIITDQKTNGENGTIQGFELGIQQDLGFIPGLGFTANYTYADSEQPNGNPLLDISKNTFNAQVYYENSGFQVRLAYTYRDEFLDTENEKRVITIGSAVANGDAIGQEVNENGETVDVFDKSEGNNYRNPTGQLDFSASYEINENFTVVTNVTNLTGEPVSFSTELGSDWKYSEADRRFTFGVRAKF